MRLPDTLLLLVGAALFLGCQSRTTPTSFELLVTANHKSAGYPPWPMKLTPRQREIIRSPDSVKVAMIDPDRRGSPGPFHGHTVLWAVELVDTASAARFGTCFLGASQDDGLYPEDFYPDYALQFRQGKTAVEVLVSPTSRGAHVFDDGDHTYVSLRGSFDWIANCFDKPHPKPTL